MIDINKILKKIPKYKKFYSVSEIYAYYDKLKQDNRFKFTLLGKSTQGRKIFMISFNTGKRQIKTLFCGYPHPNEPIGGLTAITLLDLLRKNDKNLIYQNIEWNIIVCIDPDGAKLNEGWTDKTFSFARCMHNYYRQNNQDQTEWSFPIKYKKLSFNKPTKQARCLMKAISTVKPDFYYSLHNSMIGGAYYFVGKNMGHKTYKEYHKILKEYDVPLHMGEPEINFIEVYSKAIYEEVSIKAIYDDLNKYYDDPTQYISGGGSSFEYLRKFKKNAMTLVCELPYMKHALVASTKRTKTNKRRILLRAECDQKYLKSVVLEEWNKVSKLVNKKNPFYQQVASQIDKLANNINILSKDKLINPAYNRPATESERLDTYLYFYYFLCWSYQFIRLLKGSKRCAAISKSKKILSKQINSLYKEIDKTIDFSTFEVIPLSHLVGIQLGTGLVTLNYMMKKNINPTDQ